MYSKSYYLSNGQYFKTQSELQTKIRLILNSYSLLEKLSEQDFSFMMAVLEYHPHYERKIRGCIKEIQIRLNPIYHNQRNFVLIRKDGSETDFSYLECLRASSHKKRFENACRVAIEPITLGFKRKFFDQQREVYCPYTGDRLTFLTAHVHHAGENTFQKILQNFIAENKINITEIKLNDGGIDNVVQDVLMDKELEKRWIDYHTKYSELQLVSRRANLSYLRKGDFYLKARCDW